MKIISNCVVSANLKSLLDLGLVGSLCLLLSACSVFSDKSDQYLPVVKGPDIKVPEGLSKDKVSPIYRIPEIENSRPIPAEFELPVPPDATAAIIADPYLIESALGQTWLQLFDSPSEVWPLIALYWNEYSLSLPRKDASKGLMSTAKLRGNSAKNVQLMKELEESPLKPIVFEGISFQVQVVPGVRRNTSEVQVRALLSDQIPDDKPDELDETINAKLEQAILAHMGAFITSEDIASRHSFLANEIGSESRVRLLDDVEKGQALEFRLSLPRAKSELVQALVAAGVIIADKDLDNNRVYISYLDEEELESWYHTESMVERRSRERNIVLNIEESEPGSGVVLVKANRQNDDVDEDTLVSLLTIIFEHIS